MNTKKYMTLNELKVRLRIKDNEQDDYLQIMLDDVIAHVLEWTNNSFSGGFPNDVKRAVSQLVALEKRAEDLILQSSGGWGSENEGTPAKEVKSVRIDGLQETYATSSESGANSVGGWEKYMQMENSPYKILRYHRLARMSTIKRKCRR